MTDLVGHFLIFSVVVVVGLVVPLLIGLLVRPKLPTPEKDAVYECGEPTIDREHRELFELSNAMIDAFMSSGGDPARAAPAYDRLLEHITQHFASEESLLERHGYAGLEAHRRAHAGLLSRARELRNSVVSGGAGLGGLVEFLAGDVVARHLFKADRDFFPLFNTK